MTFRHMTLLPTMMVNHYEPIPDPGGSRIDEGTVRQSDVRQGPHGRTVPAVELDTHILHFFSA